eukprot:7320378-Prymnesium_polylepis.1
MLTRDVSLGHVFGLVSLFRVLGLAALHATEEKREKGKTHCDGQEEIDAETQELQPAARKLADAL